MKKLILIGGGVLLALLIAFVTVPFLIPQSVYRAQIEKAATRTLGREVVLEGKVGLSVFPNIAARVDGVRVDNPEGFTADNFITAGSLRGTVRWLPLLSGKVEIADLSFVDASLDLEVLRDGSNNWTVAPAEHPEPKEPGETPAEPGTGGVNAAVDKARLVNASLTFRDQQSGQVYEIRELDMSASFKGLDKPLSLDADGLFNNEKFDISLSLGAINDLTAREGTPTELKLRLDSGSLSWDGQLSAAPAGPIDGTLKLNDLKIASLAQLAGVPADMLTTLALVGTVDAEINVAGTASQMTLNVAELRQSGPTGTLEANGRIGIGEQIRIDNARFDLALQNSAALASLLGMDPALFEVLGKVDLTGGVEGTPGALSVSQIVLTQKSRLVEAGFKGDAFIGDQVKLEGNLTASGDDLARVLQRLTGEPSPLQAQPFTLMSDVSGTLDKVALTDLTLKLGQSTLTGGAAVSLAPPRPKITGDLTLDTLDLDKLLVTAEPADKKAGEPKPWSDEPLPMDALSLADADVGLKVGSLKSGQLEARAIEGRMSVAGGKLAIDPLSADVFGGKVAGSLSLDSAAETPKLALTLTGDVIQVAQVTQTFTGLAPVTGQGNAKVNLTATGASPRALMASLTGNTSLDLKDGKLVGLNILQLVRSAQEAVTSGKLPTALSPSQESDFDTLALALPVKDGTVSIQGFDLAAPYVQATGEGTINLADQSLNVSIFPRALPGSDGASDLLGVNGYGLPIRVSGAWTAPSASLDTAWLVSRARDSLLDKAGGSVAGKIEDKLGGELGSIVGGALGLPEPTAEDETDTESADEAAAEDTAADSAETEPKKSAEDVLKEEALKALQKRLGGGGN